MRLRILLLTTLSASVLLAQTAQRPRPGAGGAAPGIEAIKKALDLTDQQVQQLTQLRRHEAEVLRPIRQQIQEKSQALREAMASPNPDPAVVGSLTLELRNLRQQVRQTNQEYHQKALAVLTPEQQTRVENMAKASRRMAQRGPALRGATLLNLIPPPPPAAVGPNAPVPVPERGRRGD
ncbi:MAG: Spy/CpxP family protein refolding chaperone [Bryobacteraceae bacterium]